MLKLALLGAIGYLGYRYLNSGRSPTSSARASAVAGGPLSAAATLQSRPDQSPVADPFGQLAAHPT